MTIRPAELRVQKRISTAFIEADGRSVVLQRRTRTPDGAGGTLVGDPVDQAAQLCRLLPQEDGATARTTAEGETATPEYMLMASAGANMERFDEFTLDGRRYQIVYIDDRQYEVKGEAVYLGD
jgi:hypothetical protein